MINLKEVITLYAMRGSYVPPGGVYYHKDVVELLNEWIWSADFDDTAESLIEHLNRHGYEIRQKND